MAQFDVFQTPESELVLDCQSDLLDHLNTRFVVPLLSPDDAPIVMKRLNPTFTIDGETLVMYTQFAASIPAVDCQQHIASLSGQHHVIINALDMLISGF